MSTPVFYALTATLFTWGITALGAASVIFFKQPKQKWLNIMMGFAAGVMIAASFWSLLNPAIDSAQKLGFKMPWLVAGIGFLSGACFLFFCDRLVAANRLKSCNKRAFMLMLAITMHNLPEGLAIGVAFGALNHSFTDEGLYGAILIAIGIGLQNFPEGAAISLPFRREGYSRWKSFLYGQASALVEPIGGILGALLTAKMAYLAPYALSFSAGAMILVAVHELIPECQATRESYTATFGIIFGFALMMVFDIALSF
jgi:Predicted divalent heavy-metal cations transporter